ncbi:hypothetical protein B9Z65_7825 [Elsinoe australis]|uniref:Nucleoporin NUP37 n=1 Tax=Elsinoe australis TaxID=40998 RepID=A0A2P8A0M4_9PEZI|nr:hypothetical protein B9Z65_7825 [Elsinoe australis]
MSRPKVVKSGRRLQISYDSTRRLNVTKVYPIRSSNGSTITIHGTGKGLYITWTGGRPLHFTSSSEGPVTNGAHEADSAQQISEGAESDDEVLFESDEEDPDDDQSYANIVQDLELKLESPVLHLSIPQSSNPEHDRGTSQSQSLLVSAIVVAVACEDGSAKVITLPRDPPSAASKRKRRLGAHLCSLESLTPADLPRGIAMTWAKSQQQLGNRTTSGQKQTRQSSKHAAEPAQPSGDELIIALATSEFSGSLHFFSIPISSTGSQQHIAHATASPFHSTNLDALPTSLSFNPAPESAPRHSQLLVSDISGYTLIYDLSPDSESRPPSRSTSRSTPTPTLTIRLSAPFSPSKDPSVPALSHRKRVLAACWVLSGISVLVLLEDGTIGLYALSSSSPANIRITPSPLSFGATAFIGNEPEHSSTFTDKPKRAHLVPMTPNTRRTKSEGLFSGPANGTTLPPRGGITVRSTTNIHGTPDDAVVVYYNTRVCTIPSVREWWSRNAQGPSLHGTGMQDLGGLDLGNETITGVGILPERSDRGDAVLGGNARKGDVLVAGEYRSHVVGSARQKIARRMEREDGSPSGVDRRLLDRGELGVEGLDRMLESMEGVERRVVGFMD